MCNCIVKAPSALTLYSWVCAWGTLGMLRCVSIELCMFYVVVVVLLGPLTWDLNLSQDPDKPVCLKRILIRQNSRGRKRKLVVFPQSKSCKQFASLPAQFEKKQLEKVLCVCTVGIVHGQTLPQRSANWNKCWFPLRSSPKWRWVWSVFCWSYCRWLRLWVSSATCNCQVISTQRQK